MNQNFFCDECDIEFRVRHESDEVYYEVRFCPFCGKMILDEEHYTVEDDIEE